MAFEFAIVLTGSIATGKSTAAKFFETNGFTIIDADKIAHKILDEQHLEIKAHFGNDCVKEKKVNRKILGGIVFNDKKERLFLESLLHPLIFDEIKQLSHEEDMVKKPYFIDIPLFFEKEHYPIKRHLVVYTPKDKQIERLIKRDGYTVEDAMIRIDTQVNIEEKRKRATYVIDNSGDLHQLIHECQKVKEEILGDFR
ncbi:MAG: dephospho-CoA kinase [Sulfurovum sp.]|nr:dephospho-CoA kinase [Sulfurovum sp.]